MNIKQDRAGLIGNTPLLELHRFAAGRLASGARLVVKLESFNPGGSAKDRVAETMLRDAEARGVIAQGSTVIEPTSGNTGIGLAAAAAVRGIHAIFIMPDTMSVERQKLLKAYGAQVVLTPGALGMQGAIQKADELAKEIPGSIIAGQFENPANPQAHEDTTGPEIWRDTDGLVDVFVAGVGTGGTITGTGRYLKQKNARVRVAAAEPFASAVLSGGAPGKHGLQGIGAGFIPKVMDVALLDEIIRVTDEQAYEAARRLAMTEGITTGISGGAALYAAQVIAARPDSAQKMIVALLPDGGDRYLSTDLYEA